MTGSTPPGKEELTPWAWVLRMLGVGLVLSEAIGHATGAIESADPLIVGGGLILAMGKEAGKFLALVFGKHWGR